jgi:hypothetical protein
VEVRGLESGSTTSCQQTSYDVSPTPVGTESGTVGNEFVDLPSELVAVVRKWKQLSPEDQQTVLALFLSVVDQHSID